MALRERSLTVRLFWHYGWHHIYYSKVLRFMRISDVSQKSDYRRHPNLVNDVT